MVWVVDTDVAMTSQVVRALQAKGLIVREVDAADTRAKRLGVTAAGAEQAIRATRAVEAVDGRFFAPAPAGQAVSLLRRLIDS
jgi:DNA-binding MarR family transcriptional regulator